MAKKYEQTGTLSAILKSTAKGPLDNRQVVSAKEDLIKSATWEGYAYEGMIVVAQGQLYILTDLTKLTANDYSGWTQLCTLEKAITSGAEVKTAEGDAHISVAVSQGADGHPIYTLSVDVSDKADKVAGATENNFAGLDSEGNLKDSSYNSSSFDAAGSASAAETAAKGYADTQDSALHQTISGEIGTAKGEAIASAASDATSKANAAETAAKGYADTQDAALHQTITSEISTAKGEAIASAASDATSKANAAETAAKEYADGLDSAMDSKKADKVAGATNGNFAALDENGNLKDSGKKAADFDEAGAAATAESNAKNYSDGQLATEAAKKADKVTGGTADNFVSLDANGNIKDSGKNASSFDEAGSAATAESNAKTYADNNDKYFESGEIVKGTWNTSVTPNTFTEDADGDGTAFKVKLRGSNTYIYCNLSSLADRDGAYATLSAGNIVPKEADRVTSDGGFLFRSTAGNESVSDGDAQLILLNGNVSAEGTTVNPTSIKAVGFNAYNPEHVLDGYGFDSNGDVIVSAGNKLAYVKVLAGIDAVSENNGYVITKPGTEGREYVESGVRFCTGVPTLGSNTSAVDYGKHYNSYSWLPPAEGYLVISLADLTGLCVHLAWSGYRDMDYEDYSESVVEIPSVTGGYAKAGSVYDRIDISGSQTRKIKATGVLNLALMAQNEWTHTTESGSNIYTTTSAANYIKSGTSNITHTLEDCVVTVSGTSVIVNTGTDTLPASGFIFYELDTPTVTDVDPIIYLISDFGTEEILGTTVAPSLVRVEYEPNLVDALRYLIAKAVTVVDDSLNEESENPVQNKVVTEALNDKADKEGIYPGLTAGNIIAKDSDASIVTRTDSASVLFRSAGDAEDITDGDAKLADYKGATPAGGLESFDARYYRSIGFNAYRNLNLAGSKDWSDIVKKTSNGWIRNMGLDGSGNIVASNNNTLVIVHVLKSDATSLGNAGYKVKWRTNSTAADSVVVGWISPANYATWQEANYAASSGLGFTYQPLTLTNNRSSISYLTPDIGYMLVQVPTNRLDGLCIHICWSGYRDSRDDYEEYMESVIRTANVHMDELLSFNNGTYYMSSAVTGENDSEQVRPIDGYMVKKFENILMTQLFAGIVPEIETEIDEQTSEEVTTYTYKSAKLDGIIKHGTGLYLTNCDAIVGSEPTHTLQLIEVVDEQDPEVTHSIIVITGHEAIEFAATDTFRYRLIEDVQVPLDSLEYDSPYYYVYKVSDFGTEEWLGTSIAPGSVTNYYMPNLLDTLRRLATQDEYIRSYSIDFSTNAEVVDDINMQGNISLTEISTVNIATLKYQVNGGSQRTLTLTDGAWSGVISLNNRDRITWEIGRTTPGQAAAMGVVFMNN